MRHLIVGTAGHIDHGKSSLVLALTGIDPDRLKEEKLRGITIELGFADCELGEQRALSIVDVPGHERFVRHMVAGATGIDAVLLVVAADDGVRPQTREHMDICRLLGIRHGVVALTKVDLVEPELVEVAALEVQEFLRGSFLEHAKVVRFSSRTGVGKNDLRCALESVFEEVPERPAEGIARLPVDRSFVLRGFGTVVTGTLVSGALQEGEEIEVLPAKRSGRIRSLQVHRHRVRTVRAGQRAAVNLQGLDRSQVPRGSTLAPAGALVATRRIWARVHLLPSAPESLAKGGPVRFHQGTCERAARMRPLGGNSDGTLDAVLAFAADTVLVPGDRFILRRPAPMDTVGGGVVLDIRPPRSRPSESERRALAGADLDRGIELRIARAESSGRAAADVAPELGLTATELEARLGRLEAKGRVVRAGGLLFDSAVWRKLEERSAEVLQEYHRKEPLRQGMSREELRSRVDRSVPQDAWRVFLEGLAARRTIRLSGELAAAAGHTVELTGQDRSLAGRIETRFREAGLDPPGVKEVLASENQAQGSRIVHVLLAQGRLVRIRDGRLFHAEALEQLRKKLKEYARTSKTIDVGTFKQLAGVTRKNAIPLLEQLDEERMTRRLGNVREILSV